jgi:hypothetical protein
MSSNVIGGGFSSSRLLLVGDEADLQQIEAAASSAGLPISRQEAAHLTTSHLGKRKSSSVVALPSNDTTAS